MHAFWQNRTWQSKLLFQLVFLFFREKDFKAIKTRVTVSTVTVTAKSWWKVSECDHMWWCQDGDNFTWFFFWQFLIFVQLFYWDIKWNKWGFQYMPLSFHLKVRSKMLLYVSTQTSSLVLMVFTQLQLSRNRYNSNSKGTSGKSSDHHWCHNLIHSPLCYSTPFKLVSSDSWLFPSRLEPKFFSGSGHLVCNAPSTQGT